MGARRTTRSYWSRGAIEHQPTAGRLPCSQNAHRLPACTRRDARERRALRDSMGQYLAGEPGQRSRATIYSRGAVPANNSTKRPSLCCDRCECHVRYGKPCYSPVDGKPQTLRPQSPSAAGAMRVSSIFDFFFTVNMQQKT
jgi:hypothetical protein